MCSVLTRAADDMDLDADLVIRSANEAEMADSGSSPIAQGFLIWKKVPDLRVWPLSEIEIPDDHRWYVDKLGWLYSEYRKRAYASVGGCVGVCAGASVQDGVITTSRGAGFAYTVGADVGVKESVIAESERSAFYEEDRFFLSGPLLGLEVTREVAPDGEVGRDANWDWAIAASLSPVPFGFGWVRQWNQRHDMRRSKPPEKEQS